MISESQSAPKLHKNEGIKAGSRYLRGTILEGLADASTGSISADDQQLTKFHGVYQQDDRDVRNQRRKHKLDKAYSFLRALVCLEACAHRSSGLLWMIWQISAPSTP